jgi:hypothetical protein
MSIAQANMSREVPKWQGSPSDDQLGLEGVMAELHPCYLYIIFRNVENLPPKKKKFKEKTMFLKENKEPFRYMRFYLFLAWNLQKKLVIEQTCVEAAPLLKYNEPDMSKEEAGPTTQAKHLVKWNQFGKYCKCIECWVQRVPTKS